MGCVRTVIRRPRGKSSTREKPVRQCRAQEDSFPPAAEGACYRDAVCRPLPQPVQGHNASKPDLLGPRFGIALRFAFSLLLRFRRHKVSHLWLAD